MARLSGVELDFTYHKPSESKRHLHGDSMLQDHANHEIDYVNFLLGMCSMKAFKLLDEFDRYEMTGIREDGVSFHFKGTRRLDSRIFAETINVRFEKAELVVYTKPGENSFIYDHETQSQIEFDVLPTDYDYRFDSINRNFVNAVLGKEAVYLKREEMLLNTAMSVTFQTKDFYEFKF